MTVYCLSDYMTTFFSFQRTQSMWLFPMPIKLSAQHLGKDKLIFDLSLKRRSAKILVRVYPQYYFT